MLHTASSSLSGMLLSMSAAPARILQYMLRSCQWPTSRLSKDNFDLRLRPVWCRERARKERLALLKSNDMEGYLRIAQTATTGKESRLKELLKSTDACLRQLSLRLAKLPGKAANGRDADALEEATSSGDSHSLKVLDFCRPQSLSSQQCKRAQQACVPAVRAVARSFQKGRGLPAGDILALRESSSQWNQMSASLQATITEQPAMLTGGSLRDYQMAVRSHLAL